MPKWRLQDHVESESPKFPPNTERWKREVVGNEGLGWPYEAILSETANRKRHKSEEAKDR